MNYRRLLQIVKSPFRLINSMGQPVPWWVKIVTLQPKCIYYFGPFDSQLEARESQSGYVEDLREEKAREISIEIKQDCPKLLTISEE